MSTKSVAAQTSFPKAVSFHLFRDHLEFSHYGIPFSTSDVRGICGLVQGTKREDLTTIGKFGIGFKSVYAYTLKPEVHSGDEHFLIESFVIPKAVPAKRLLPDGTLFYLPFDNPEVEPEAAFEEIAESLQRLDPRSLLFLTHIETVEWKIADRETGAYSRQNRKREGSTAYVTLSSRDRRARPDEEWLCFERPIPLPKTNAKAKVQVAYSLQTEKKGGREIVQPIAGATLYAFFATEKETHLGMLIQEPYCTTPSRDNIPKDDAWNKRLLKLTVELIVDSLVRLKEIGLLSVSALETLPLDSQVFSSDHFLHSVFEAVRDALRKKPLIPKHGGGFVAGACARMARGSGLRELLKSTHLQLLFGTTKKLQWVTDEISEVKTPELREYLLREVGVDELTPQNIASTFTEKFMKAQSDQWVVELYSFLSDQPSLWKPGGPIRMKPFIRTQTHRHIAPFASDGTPQVYLPSKGFTDYQVVRSKLCRNESALKFLKQLGLMEPDLVDDVIRNVLSKYSGEKVNVSADDYSNDIERILTAARTVSTEQREKLLAALRESNIVMAADAGDGTKYVSPPTLVYLPSPCLNELFQGIPGLYLADDSYSCLQGEGICDLLKACGAARHLRQVPIGSRFTGEELAEMRTQAGAANSSGEETVKDFTLHGLEQLLDKLPTLPGMQAARRAGLLWEALRDLKDKHFSGIYRWFYCKPCMCKFDAAFVLQLNETPWVPGPDGQLERPESVIFDTLGWEPNLFLQSKIRFKAPISETLARELGLEPAMFDELKKRGITSRAELVARLGEEPEQPNGQPSSRNVDDPVKNILGDMPGPTPPAPDPMSPELQGWGGGSGAGWGTESAGGGGTPCIPAAAGSKTGGKSSTTGSGAGKRTPSSAGGRPFISYVGAHPDDKESDPDSLGQSARMALEEQAIANILLHEPRLTRTPINNPGFDLIESSPDGNPVRWVEVKAMTGSLQDRPVGLSRTQFECARDHGGSYWLYAVEHADDDSARIVRIQDPAGKVRTFTFDHGWVAVAIVDADQEDSEE